MYNKATKAIANVLYASVGTVVFTSSKLSQGYNRVVTDGRMFVGDVREHYLAKKYPKPHFVGQTDES